MNLKLTSRDTEIDNILAGVYDENKVELPLMWEQATYPPTVGVWGASPSIDPRAPSGRGQRVEVWIPTICL